MSPPIVSAACRPTHSTCPCARFAIGEVVRHRLFDFRGVIFDVDPEFANSEEWYEAIPEAMRPSKDQPFYHLLAENAEASYVAYVSQQNLVADDSDEPIDHPAIGTHVRPLRRRPLPAAARAPALGATKGGPKPSPAPVDLEVDATRP